MYMIYCCERMVHSKINDMKIHAAVFVTETNI